MTQPLDCQKDLFSLDADVHYLNCAYMSPLMKIAEDAAIERLRRQRNPYNATPARFFDEAREVRQLYATLIGGDPDRIALLPSVSYGMGIITRNFKPSRSRKVVTIYEEFPSDVLALQRICIENGTELITVRPPDTFENRAEKWNEKILDAIQPGVALVNMSMVHWADGTRFDLQAIGNKAKEVGALFIVDGTQAVGAMNININDYKIDALICAGYKWLFGPYTSGFGYFGEFFDNGIPIEETWMNRIGSENFRMLVNYPTEYTPKAGRYNMGQFSNFINLSIVKASLQKLLEWTPAAISEYCHKLTMPLRDHLRDRGCIFEEGRWQSNHICGFRLPPNKSIESLEKKLLDSRVIISLRGDNVRVSPNVYNNQSDIQALINAF